MNNHQLMWVPTGMWKQVFGNLLSFRSVWTQCQSGKTSVMPIIQGKKHVHLFGVLLFNNRLFTNVKWTDITTFVLHYSPVNVIFKYHTQMTTSGRQWFRTVRVQQGTYKNILIFVQRYFGRYNTISSDQTITMECWHCRLS